MRAGPGTDTGAGVTVVVTGHWLSAWFLRLLARPWVVVDGEERRVRWGEPTPVSLPEQPVLVGAGVRYLGRGPLLGCEQEPYGGHLGARGGAPRLTLRNGFWNHTPFRLVRDA